LRAILYCRISTTDKNQNPEVQLVPLREFVEKRGWQTIGEFIDQESGLKDRRNGFESTMRSARQGKVDVVVVAALDRWSRSLKSLISTLDELRSLNVSFVSLREAIDLTTPTGELMFHIIGAFSQFEASLIRQRVQMGLFLAKSKGVRLGRPPLEINTERIVELHSQGLSIRQIARETKVSPSSVFKTLKKMGTKISENSRMKIGEIAVF
jgi:DNA invertase Pin-like site-specific DNA recombinase